jgi:hypothetical protein
MGRKRSEKTGSRLEKGIYKQKPGQSTLPFSSTNEEDLTLL